MKLTAPWLTTPASQKVMGMLTRSGFEAYFVGGCVRNALIGAPVSDLDISTNARPDQVIENATQNGLRAVPTGIDHGTVTVIADGQPFEITTFRRDVETDGRRAVVAFSDRMEDDAHRRDFTMNALYADQSGTIHDPLGGLSDLRARRVRFIDDAEQRIREDYLRILRFFRFHAWYGDPENGIDADGLAACTALAEGISSLSKERIGAEMLKTLAAPDPAPTLATMQMSGVLMNVLPGADVTALAPLIHFENALSLKPAPIRRLAGIGGEDVVTSLRLSKADAKRFNVLRQGVAMNALAAELGYRFGEQTALEIIALNAAMTMTPPSDDAMENAAKGAAHVFPVSAQDLMPDVNGPALGKALSRLEGDWIASGFCLSKSELLARL